MGKLRTAGGTEYGSASPPPGAWGCRLGRPPHLRAHLWEGTAVAQGDSHLNARPSLDARRGSSPSTWGAPVTASATHTPAQALARSAHRPWNENPAITKTIGITLAHYCVSREVPGSILKCKTVLGTLYADRKSTRLNSSHKHRSRMPSSA